MCNMRQRLRPASPPTGPTGLGHKIAQSLENIWKTYVFPPLSCVLGKIVAFHDNVTKNVRFLLLGSFLQKFSKISPAGFGHRIFELDFSIFFYKKSENSATAIFSQKIENSATGSHRVYPGNVRKTKTAKCKWEWTGRGLKE